MSMSMQAKGRCSRKVKAKEETEKEESRIGVLATCPNGLCARFFGGPAQSHQNGRVFFLSSLFPRKMVYAFFHGSKPHAWTPFAPFWKFPFWICSRSSPCNAHSDICTEIIVQPFCWGPDNVVSNLVPTQPSSGWFIASSFSFHIASVSNYPISIKSSETLHFPSSSSTMVVFSPTFTQKHINYMMIKGFDGLQAEETHRLKNFCSP